MTRRVVTAKAKSDMNTGAKHAWEAWLGSSKDDPYWDGYVKAIKRERAKSDRLARKPRK